MNQKFYLLRKKISFLGTPQRILEHILEYVQPWKRSIYDETLEDFILMYPVFMKTRNLFEHLLKKYKAEDAVNVSYDKSMKRKIVYFVVRWSHIVRYLREDEEEVEEFLQVRKLFFFRNFFFYCTYFEVTFVFLLKKTKLGKHKFQA